VSARLLCRVRAGVTLSFELGEKEAVLGREPSLGVALPVEGVSRRHARIKWDGKSHWIEDLRSTNGTFVNGKAVVREKLRHLDVITLGREVDLVLLARPAEAPARPALAITRASLVREGGDAAVYEIAPGEITLGRSPSCNVVVESERVSKVHARIERTRDQLLLEDLASVNGTFVNGARVKAVFLNAGDMIALAGDEPFRVDLQLDEVGLASGRHSATLGREARRQKQRFSADWKTRLAWSEEERDELSDLRKRIDAYDRRRAAAPSAAAPASPKAAPPKAAPPKPAPPQPAPPQPAPPPAPAKVQAPEIAAPRATPPPAAPPAPSAVPAKAPAPPAAPPPLPTSAAPAKAAPAATPPRPAAPAAKAEPAVPAVAKPAAVICEFQLRAEGIDLVVTAPGEYELGRAAGLPLRVDHPTVSRHHARIILSEDRTTAYLQDQGGVNKTRLNGRPLQKLSPLAEGDQVRLGDVELVVSITRG
jgi:pSer/pThr/pTyr-binding forkhead associated (FHA) protein